MSKNSFIRRVAGGPWADLPRRLLTIGIGVPTLWMIWCHDGLRVVFFQCVHVLCAIEWSLMTQKDIMSSRSSDNFLRWKLWHFPMASFVMVNCANDALFLSCVVMATAVATVSFSLSSKLYMAWIQGIMFISLPFRIWIKLTSVYGFVPTVTLLLTVWNGDTGALVTGRLVGGTLPSYVIPNSLRRALCRISPNKSVEGLLGALIFGMLTYTTMVPYFWKLVERYNVSTGSSARSSINFDIPLPTFLAFPNDTTHLWLPTTPLLMGLAMSMAAVLGDVMESALKRHYEVKDTGRLLPGHGGILDRFDSSLIAVTLYYWYLQSDYVPERGY